MNSSAYCLWVAVAVVGIGLVGGPRAAEATTISVVVPLTGEQEEPEPVFTGAFGTALLLFDTDTNSLSVSAQVFGIDVADLFDIPTFGPFHLHVETPDPPTDQVGPIAIYFGGLTDWVQHLDGITLESTGTPSGLVPEEEIVAALFAGKTYLNLHTTDFPAGELRGDVLAIPEPRTISLLMLGLLGLSTGRRRLSRNRAD
ncbi:MAG: CHRD domain-containing protein [Myxococcota bacterium]|nr:CHRD domain-containing protein [Myxococcota bacterium]